MFKRRHRKPHAKPSPRASGRPRIPRVLVSVAGWTAIALGTIAILAAQDAAPTPRQKALQAIQSAIEARGGQAYLSMSTQFNRGNWFAFGRHGERSGLVRFFEWIHFEPLKYCIQFGTGGRQSVTVYNLAIGKGWNKEGKKYVEELPEEDLEDFRKSAKHDLDVVLRKRVHEQGVKLFFYGADEVTGGGNFVAVELLDESNDSVVVYFDRDTHLPARMEYPSVDKLGNRHKRSEEYINWHEVAGVQVPLRIDFFQDGNPTRQRHLVESQVNPSIPESQFLEPEVKK